MDEAWHRFQTSLPDFAAHLLGAAFILAAGWFALKLLVGPFRTMLGRSRIDPSVASFLANSLRSALIVVVLVGVLQQLGVQTASLLTLLGTAGLAIALSLQGSLANFASGLLIVSFRTVRVGDLIEVGDVRGRVAELLPFHVVLVTLDNQRITVPNTSLTSGAVRNHSALPSRRVQWTLPVTPRDDLAQVKEALLAVLHADRRVLADPAAQVYVQEWGEDKRVLAVVAWAVTADYLAVQQELLEPLGLRVQELRMRAGHEPSAAGGAAAVEAAGRLGLPPASKKPCPRL